MTKEPISLDLNLIVDTFISFKQYETQNANLNAKINEK